MTSHAFNHTFHVGETANPFAIQMVLADGTTARADVFSCTFKLVDQDDHASVLIGPVACQSVDGGLCEYHPTALEMAAIAATLNRPMSVLAQYVATLEDGTVLPTDYISGTIEANL
jgi:hypothetical protein